MLVGSSPVGWVLLGWPFPPKNVFFFVVLSSPPPGVSTSAPGSSQGKGSASLLGSRRLFFDTHALVCLLEENGNVPRTRSLSSIRALCRTAWRIASPWPVVLEVWVYALSSVPSGCQHLQGTEPWSTVITPQLSLLVHPAALWCLAACPAKPQRCTTTSCNRTGDGLPQKNAALECRPT